MYRLGKMVFLLVLVFCNLAAATSHDSLPLQQKQFINQLVKKHHFNRAKLTTLFNELYEDKTIVARMNRPFEKSSWDRYRHFFITKNRIEMGAAYWQTHQKILAATQKKYGVPAGIIVAIAGVETLYGKHKGDDNVLNTLYTLAFYYPKRSKYFTKELKQYLLLARENKLPLKALKGSYAGAVGIPQFMPSSYRHYGVSANNKTVDLFHSHDDAIVSIGHYLSENGWRPNAPIARRYQKQTKLKMKAKRAQFGSKTAPEDWLLFHNFNVILRYNKSKLYAMAVFQLSQAIKKQYVINQRQNTSDAISSTGKIKQRARKV